MSIKTLPMGGYKLFENYFISHNTDLEMMRKLDAVHVAKRVKDDDDWDNNMMIWSDNDA